MSVEIQMPDAYWQDIDRYNRHLAQVRPRRGFTLPCDVPDGEQTVRYSAQNVMPSPVIFIRPARYAELTVIHTDKAATEIDTFQFSLARSGGRLAIAQARFGETEGGEGKRRSEIQYLHQWLLNMLAFEWHAPLPARSVPKVEHYEHAHELMRKTVHAVLKG